MTYTLKTPISELHKSRLPATVVVSEDGLTITATGEDVRACDRWLDVLEYDFEVTE